MAKKDGGYARDTPEKFTNRSDNKPIIPPPRKPKHKMDTNLVVGIKGWGSGPANPGDKTPGGSGTYPRYRTAEAMEAVINEYFVRKDFQEKPYTMAGLALSLGFKSAAALKTYEQRGEDFADVIEIARTRVEEWKNELLLEGGKQTNGVIFDLKNNHGWTDRMEQKTTVEAGDSLSKLLTALQGTVLRPVINHQPDEDDIEDGVFEEAEAYEGSFDDFIDGAIDQDKALDINDLI